MCAFCFSELCVMSVLGKVISGQDFQPIPLRASGRSLVWFEEVRCFSKTSCAVRRRVVFLREEDSGRDSQDAGGPSPYPSGK